MLLACESSCEVIYYMLPNWLVLLHIIISWFDVNITIGPKYCRDMFTSESTTVTITDSVEYEKKCAIAIRSADAITFLH